MKTIFCFSFILILWSSLIFTSNKAEGNDLLNPFQSKPQTIKSTNSIKPVPGFGNIPLYFIFNKGQVASDVHYYAKTAKYNLWLTKEGFTFDSLSQINKKSGRANQNRFHKKNSSKQTQHDVSQLLFVNARKNPELVPLKFTEHKVNYLTGQNRTKWHRNIPTSKAVLYRELYQKIDLKVYGIEKQIEYDWIIKPGGNPDDISFEYNNVQCTRLDNEGNLIVKTEFGKLIHKKPLSYQQIIEGKPTTIEVKFKQLKKNMYGFEVASYNKNYPLIIDPVVLVYSTYLGGNIDEEGYSIAVDTNGNAYVTGYTDSTNFPTAGPYQTDETDTDIFITKLSTDGSSLVYSTYLGGDDIDEAYGIKVDASGRAYITGYTDSTDFPTVNAYQVNSDTDNSTDSDVFLSKLSATGDSLLYSTYLGGNDDDFGNCIAVDQSGNAYLAGSTYSSDFPTQNEYQAQTSITDAFVTKIDTTETGANSLLYSTYLGGDAYDECYAITLDSNHFVYITGQTNSSDFPTHNPYQTNNDTDGTSTSDAFVSKINTTLAGANSLLYSTYLGGFSDDTGFGIAVDSSFNMYITGATASTDFPLSNPLDSNLGGLADAFVTKISSSGDSLIYSTYLGGNTGGMMPFIGYDEGNAILIDSSNNVYLTGNTFCPDYPTANAIDTDLGGIIDAFFTKISPSGDSLIFSTYLGGDSEDQAYAIAADSYGNIYIAGSTSSTNFPTLNPFQSDFQGGDVDVFVTKFSETPTVTTLSVSNIGTSSASSGGEVTNSGGAAVTSRGVCWSTSANPTISDPHTTDGNGIGSFNSSITGLTSATTYYIRAYATNSCGTGYGNERNFSTNVTISGTITDGTNPIPGVTVTFSHNSHTETSDIDGNYSYIVPYGTTTTIIPSHDAVISWSPTYIHLGSVSANMINQNFQGSITQSYTISGRITFNDVGFGGVTLTGLPGNPKTNASGYYASTVIAGWSGTTTPSKAGYSFIPGNRSYTTVSTNQTNHDYIAVADTSQSPHIQINKKQLNFGALQSGPVTSDQSILVSNGGTGTLYWTVASDQSWINCSPSSGNDSGIVSISVNTNNLNPGTYTGNVTFTGTNAENSPQVVTVTLDVYESSKTPYGVFSTPIDNSTVCSSIPVTGWVLDDIEVQSVKIYREAGNDLAYIGDAVFVEGARPDVELSYPYAPLNYRAGWGYMLLTNFLPNEGNGVFVLHAIALDKEGHSFTLGKKTITVDNKNATKPFGTIDKPGQGETISGSDYLNWGWVLTPKPNTIPTDGSTIEVYIDGVSIGNPDYNLYRIDIASLLPNYNNSNGAIGKYDFDTTQYENGVHTIQWRVFDDAGNKDGIGSRYFSIQNFDSFSKVSTQSSQQLGKLLGALSTIPIDLKTPLTIFNKSGKTSSTQIMPNKSGKTAIEIEELELLEVAITQSSEKISGYLVKGKELTTLPIGSTIKNGKFYWSPGPGFYGQYRFFFIIEKEKGTLSKKELTVTIKPMSKKGSLN